MILAAMDDFKHRHRRSIRLQGYDYSQNGAYFVTMRVHQREVLFGEIVDDEMKLNEFGKVVEDQWLQTAVVRLYVTLDDFVVMPNHFHAIIFLTGDQNESNSSNETGDVGARRTDVDQSRQDIVGAQRAAPLQPHVVPHSLGAIVRGFKSAATKRINELRDTRGAPVWQRNYYEQVIRNESSLNDIRSYIQNNPSLWAEDQENSANLRR